MSKSYDIRREHKQQGLNPAFEEESMFKQLMAMYKQMMDEEKARELLSMIDEKEE